MMDELVERLRRSVHAEFERQADANHGRVDDLTEHPMGDLVDGYFDFRAIARACLSAIEADYELVPRVQANLVRPLWR